MREATREAIAHCIYGVDKNLLAVDLCRVALWLESHTGDKPLTFLDHRIRCGDALVSVFDLAVLKYGIPDNAFSPLEGDDKETAKELKRRNRSRRAGQRELLDWQPERSVENFADPVARLMRSATTPRKPFGRRNGFSRRPTPIRLGSAIAKPAISGPRPSSSRSCRTSRR